MDEIDTFAKRLAARTAGRGRRLCDRFQTTDDGGLQRQHNGRSGESGNIDREASPPKRQCLSENKGNDTQRPRGLAALRSSAWNFATTLSDEEMTESSLPSTERSDKILPPQRPSTTLDTKVANVKGKEPVKTVNVWDSKVIASLEAQGFSRTPSASKLVYAFWQRNKAGADSSITPPHPPPPSPPPSPIPSTFPGLTSATKQTDRGVHHFPSPAQPKPRDPTSIIQGKGNRVPLSMAAPPKPARVAVTPELQTATGTPDPSMMSVHEKRALFDCSKLRDDATSDKTSSPAPELLTVSERAALFEQAAAAHVKDTAKTRFGLWPRKRQSVRCKGVLELAMGGSGSCESQYKGPADVPLDGSRGDQRNSQDRELHLSEKREGEADEEDVEEYDKEEQDGEDTECMAEPCPMLEEGQDVEETSSLLMDEESLQREPGKKVSTEQKRTHVPSSHSVSRLYPELPSLEHSPGHNNMDSPTGTLVMTADTTVQRGTAEKSPKPDEGLKTVLVHTLSVYRRQQKLGTPCALNTAPRVEGVVCVEKATKLADSSDLLTKIQGLQRDAESQAVVMAQASQALELCRASPEFMGSSEQVEGERLLLLASQRRQACLAEAERLRTLGAMGPMQGPNGGGTLTIGELQLPLKRQFLAAQLQGRLGEDVHHFVCLVREGGQLRATQLLSTSEDSVASRGSLCFSNHMALHNLSPNFRVSFLVYALQTQRETLPHDQKYHIRKESNKLRLTPKSKKQTSKPSLSSAKGSVRTSSFGLIGSLQLNRSNCHYRSFIIDKVPVNSPLEGTLLMQAKLTVEHSYNFKGFLSMFEEIRGFGAWHRRWCVLRGPRLSCWSYPEDEGHKEPMGHVELSECVRARPSSRDECARPHAFALEQRNAQLRIMAADTKEERSQWCHVLGDILSALEHWGKEYC